RPRSDHRPPAAGAHAVAEAFLAFGGNVGDARATLDAAVARMCDGALVRLIARSSDYRTPPWGVQDPAPFLTLCILLPTAPAPPPPPVARARHRRPARTRPPPRASLGTASGRHRYPRLRRCEGRRDGPDPPSPASVRTRLRPRAARRDRGRPADCRASRARC